MFMHTLHPGRVLAPPLVMHARHSEEEVEHLFSMDYTHAYTQPIMHGLYTCLYTTIMHGLYTCLYSTYNA